MGRKYILYIVSVKYDIDNIGKVIPKIMILVDYLHYYIRY